MQQRQLRAKRLLCNPRFCACVSSLKQSRQLLCSVRFVFVSTFNLQTRKSICRRNHQFEQTGCLCKGKSSGQPRVSQENVRRIQDSFERSPRKSTHRVSRELGIPQPTVWRVLRRRIAYSECVFVVLSIRYEMRMCRIILSYVVFPAVPYFSVLYRMIQKD